MELEKSKYRSIESEAIAIIEGDEELKKKLLAICVLLEREVEYYDWVGFYLTGSRPRELILGPFVGTPTIHVCIPFGKGICGQAAERKRTIIIQDVSKETNYLACASDVESEIVVPIMKGDDVVGELDIDSHRKGPFTWEDRVLLEKICLKLGPLMK
ncbi:MAG: GAF domain-containing protein [Candidatus Krumholzibacteriota bacterium]|nr:GAF domain-containing protein [Candidatus Krumholzibacteriota bacterium]